MTAPLGDTIPLAVDGAGAEGQGGSRGQGGSPRGQGQALLPAQPEDWRTRGLEDKLPGRTKRRSGHSHERPQLRRVAGEAGQVLSHHRQRMQGRAAQPRAWLRRLPGLGAHTELPESVFSSPAGPVRHLFPWRCSDPREESTAEAGTCVPALFFLGCPDWPPCPSAGHPRPFQPSL